MRPERELNPRVTVLQTVALPLRHQALCTNITHFEGWGQLVKDFLRIQNQLCFA
jgi:hypothetical protein